MHGPRSSRYPRLPGEPAFIFAANVGGGVRVPGLLAIVYRRRNLMVAACALGIPVVISAPATNSPDIPAQIEKLASLRDKGILTADEFDAKKAELLAKL